MTSKMANLAEPHLILQTSLSYVLPQSLKQISAYIRASTISCAVRAH